MSEPVIEVWKFSHELWTWGCEEVSCDGGYGVRHDFPTHAEALAAALEHCAKARR